MKVIPTLALLSAAALAVWTYNNQKIPKVLVKTKTIYKTVYRDANKSALLILNKATLEKDIQRYGGISDDSKAKILNAIFKYSDEYKINPLLIYSVIATESSFRFWIRHSLTTIDIKGKKIQTRAIGLGAVIFEWWGSKLDFIQVKSDLYDIDKNVHATAAILAHCISMPKLKGIKTNAESGFIRYFGGGTKNKWYANKVNDILSNLLKNELYK